MAEVNAVFILVERKPKSTATIDGRLMLFLDLPTVISFVKWCSKVLSLGLR